MLQMGFNAEKVILYPPCNGPIYYVSDPAENKSTTIGCKDNNIAV